MHFIKANKAELTNAVANAKARKSSFQTSRFRDGMLLKVVGYDFVYDEDKATPASETKLFPVLCTEMNGKPFDNIFASTLVRSVVDADGTEHTPNGAVNKEAIRLWQDDAIKTDEEALQALVKFCEGKDVKIVRKRGYKRLTRTGDIMPAALLEVDLA
jgi:hypothetical protein